MTCLSPWLPRSTLFTAATKLSSETRKLPAKNLEYISSKPVFSRDAAKLRRVDFSRHMRRKRRRNTDEYMGKTKEQQQGGRGGGEKRRAKKRMTKERMGVRKVENIKAKGIRCRRRRTKKRTIEDNKRGGGVAGEYTERGEVVTECE